jgi:hypothetical protein
LVNIMESNIAVAIATVTHPLCFFFCLNKEPVLFCRLLKYWA